MVGTSFPNKCYPSTGPHTRLWWIALNSHLHKPTPPGNEGKSNFVLRGKEERRLIRAANMKFCFFHICPHSLLLIAPARVSQDDKLNCRTTAKLLVRVCEHTLCYFKESCWRKFSGEPTDVWGISWCEGRSVFHLYTYITSRFLIKLCFSNKCLFHWIYTSCLFKASGWIAGKNIADYN